MIRVIKVLLCCLFSIIIFASEVNPQKNDLSSEMAPIKVGVLTVRPFGEIINIRGWL